MADARIGIVTDSTCDLTDSVLQENHIHVVPIRIIYAACEYRDRLDITAEQIFERMAQEVPKSSLPLPQDVLDMLDSLKAQGYTDVVYLSIAAGLSGSYNLVKMLAQQYSGLRIEVVDSCTVSMGLGFLALEAAREAERTGDVQAVVEKVRRIRAGMQAVFVIRTLEYLVRGGRIGRVEAAMGALLDVKPIIEFGLDGVCHTIAKARGFKNAVQKMADMIKARYGGKRINLAVMHAAAPTEAVTLLDEVKKFATVCESTVSQIGPALGVYSGPGLLGIVAYEAEQA